MTKAIQANVPAAGPLANQRVAVLLFSYYPSDPRPRRAAEALVQQGAEVDLICLQHADRESRREVFNGVRILRLPIERKRGGKFGYVMQYGLFIAACFFLLTWRSLKRRYHLVHVHNMPDALVYSALVPKLLGAKLILDLHDPMPELMMTIFGLQSQSRAVRLLQRVEKWSIALADAVLTVNLACKRIFSNRSCAPEKVRVVMNSPDETIFKYRDAEANGAEGRDSSRPFVLMYHGSIVERHGLDLLVEAVESLKSTVPTILLQVYGQKTPFLERVMARVTQLGLEDRVKYLGEKGLEGIAAAIDQCDVGVIPNRRSIFTELNTPTRIFEYLSRGKTVIAPASPGILDYFDTESLLFFELGDARDLAQKIKQAYEHPEEAHTLVQRGQAVYRCHRWSEERAVLERLATELLQSRLNGQGRTCQSNPTTPDPVNTRL